MTRYHAFVEIDPNTTADFAVGFLNLDQDILTSKLSPADGIVAGINATWKEGEDQSQTRS